MAKDPDQEFVYSHIPENGGDCPFCRDKMKVLLLHPEDSDNQIDDTTKHMITLHCDCDDWALMEQEYNITQLRVKE